MTSISSFGPISYLVGPLLTLCGYVAILGVCIFGVVHPSLRREFIWFGLGALLRCLASAVYLVPQIVRLGAPSGSSSSTMSAENTRLIFDMANGISLLALLLFLVGFILLAVRARTVAPGPY